MHPKFVADFPRIDIFAFVTKDRAARHHSQLRQLREAVDDAFRNSI
jgi:hypothetical protein